MHPPIMRRPFGNKEVREVAPALSEVCSKCNKASEHQNTHNLSGFEKVSAKKKSLGHLSTCFVNAKTVSNWMSDVMRPHSVERIILATLDALWSTLTLLNGFGHLFQSLVRGEAILLPGSSLVLLHSCTPLLHLQCTSVDGHVLLLQCIFNMPRAIGCSLRSRFRASDT